MLRMRFEWFEFRFEALWNGSNLHSNALNRFRMLRILHLNASNPFRMLRTWIRMFRIPFEWFEFAFECFDECF